MAVTRTFVMLKPDAVARGLTGEITARFERAGLKLVALKMLRPTAQQAQAFYPNDEKWLTTLGEKSRANFTELKLDIVKTLGTQDPLEIGKKVKTWLTAYLSSGPVVAMVWEGNHAVPNVRRLVGATVPFNAVPGTIRGDYSCDSSDHANGQARVLRNLIHASGAPEEADAEIKFWFSTDELMAYQRAGENHLGFTV